MHNVEENLLGDSVDANIVCGGEMNDIFSMWGLVSTSYKNGSLKASARELVFLDKVPVYARDLSSRVNEDMGVNILKGV